MKGWNRISFVPDNSLLLAFNGLQFIEALEAWATTLAERVLLRCAERSQCRCLCIMAAQVITDPAPISALFPKLLYRTGIEFKLVLNGLECIRSRLVVRCTVLRHCLDSLPGFGFAHQIQPAQRLAQARIVNVACCIQAN
jgi:hypothetical protein